MWKYWTFQALRAPDTGTGGGGDGGAAAGAGGGQGVGAQGGAGRLDAADGAAAAAAAASAWKLPDGVPDHLRADTPDAFAAKTFEDWMKQRQQISKYDPAKSADEYAFTPSDAIKDLVGDVSKDPVFNAARESAFKAGVPKAAFNGFIGGVYEALAAQKLIPPPYDPGKERAAFLGEEGKGLNEAQQVEKMRPLLEGAQAFVTSLTNNGTLDQAGAGQLMALLDTAAGAKAVLALQKMVANKGLSPGGQSGGTESISREALRARNADPRNQRGRQEYDRAFAEETQRLYQKLGT